MSDNSRWSTLRHARRTHTTKLALKRYIAHTQPTPCSRRCVYFFFFFWVGSKISHLFCHRKRFLLNREEKNKTGRTFFYFSPFFVFEASRTLKSRGTQTLEIRELLCGQAGWKINLAATQHAKPRLKKSLFVHHSTDPQSDVARARSWAAIYVQDFDAPCVLQFAWISALCCALHRSTSLVIHRSGSYIKRHIRFLLSFSPTRPSKWMRGRRKKARKKMFR